MSITRRLFLSRSAGVGVVAASISLPPTAEAMEPAQYTAVQTEIVEKVKAWQEAHRAAVRADAAYSTSLRAKPIDKAECDRCWSARIAANNEVGSAREAMIFALWRVS